jgi:hypothetical protein
MGERDDPKAKPSPAKAAREAELAAALRANLKRRKAPTASARKPAKAED